MRLPQHLFAIPVLFVPLACSGESDSALGAAASGAGGDATQLGGAGAAPTGGVDNSAGSGAGVAGGAAGAISAGGAMGGTAMGGTAMGGTAMGGTAMGGTAMGGAGGAGGAENAGAGGAEEPGAGGMSGDAGGAGMESGGAGGEGEADGGAGGMSGEGEGDEGVVPSPGCAKSAGRPEGGKVYKAGVSWLVFPESYDGTTPLPVLWGWHGCGSYNFGDATRTEYWDETRKGPFKDEYVVAIPLAASGDCFDYNTDIVRTRQLYDELTEEFCVDLNHMFGTGHSSGANFLHRMLQADHQADWEYLGLRGIAPVASGPVNNQTTQVPVMYIHSPGESVNPDGPAGNFRTANGCSSESVPYEVDACNSSDDGDAVNANCISYNNCDVETLFCPHDDSAYSGTFHGIPCFFYQGAYDFFESL